jgi:muramoyltetrapeptide carboxypeptidase
MSIKETIQLPSRLKPGDKIGIAAPAGPFDRETFFRGVHIFEEKGFEVFFPDGLLEATGYLAGSDDHRAQLVNQLFADNSVDAIICARGGYGSLRILPLLDYDVIAKNPKVFIGFSDITALLIVLFARCGLVTFHGPVVTSLADAHELTVSSLFQTITSDGKLEKSRSPTVSQLVPEPGLEFSLVVIWLLYAIWLVLPMRQILPKKFCFSKTGQRHPTKLTGC